MKNFLIFLFAAVSLFNSCSDNDSITEASPVQSKELEIKGVDFSFLPEVRESGEIYFNQNGTAEDMLNTFRNAGGNVVRLRLWVDPATSNSNFATVKALSQEIKGKGMKVMLTVHYSDSWADPGKQSKPQSWSNFTFTELKTAVNNYTKQIITEINPEYIQIGNEINNGFLWPEGRISNTSQFRELLQSGISAVRDSNSSTKIILHYAGTDGAEVFFNSISGLSYDIIGISYYPNWHGKDLAVLQQKLTSLSNQFSKPILIAETSYPFTLDWKDQTHNVVGSNSQIISQYTATRQGQKDFLQKIRTISTEVPKGIGFVYWGAEWTAYKGAAATDGSSWENQAFWDFENRANPVFDVYK